ncbi:hypothetical protein [Actinoplanes sp. NPDC020271]|uniref:hypothetical protein n=1 Tax=Actinoplanes sp. NPDC020271 TaxID=3363896 RepID=UPI0037B2B443
MRWDRQVRLLTTAAAVSAALADPDIDQAAAAAVLELLPALRADLAGIERAALAAAHRTNVPADVIAAAQRPGTPGGHR